jgi:RNA polymerase sigma-70 factor, ECF subfamily
MTTEPVNLLSNLSDADLARRAGDRRAPGDAMAAFKELHDRYVPVLWLFLKNRLRRSEADDALQEVWLRVWNAIGIPERFDGRDFKAWAFKIARNYLIDVRRRQVVPTSSLDGDGRGAPIDPPDPRVMSADQEEARSWRADVLARCLQTLKPDERSMLKARLGGMDFAEIATRGKVTVDRVYRILFDAKSKLKSCVERSGS